MIKVPSTVPANPLRSITPSRQIIRKDPPMKINSENQGSKRLIKFQNGSKRLQSLSIDSGMLPCLPIGRRPTYSRYDIVVRLRYRSSRHDNTASSLQPCRKHNLNGYIPLWPDRSSGAAIADSPGSALQCDPHPYGRYRAFPHIRKHAVFPVKKNFHPWMPA